MTHRYAIGPNEAKQFDTHQIRENFLIQNMMQQDKCTLVYTHYDRMIVGGVVPVRTEVALPTDAALRADYFLERRELGIINVGGPGKIKTNEATFDIAKLGCVYVGKGIKEVYFSSDDAENPAVYFLLSCPAHQSYESRKMPKEEASPLNLGSVDTANERTVYKYIHTQGIQSCQLVMGLTVLSNGSVWNTIPSHVHDRRMEAYFYFDVKEGQRVLHLMGHPQETRHMFVDNHEAIVSPPWSIHSGCGTASYSFIWGMAGENRDYTDMDPVHLTDIR
ncbi:MAG: kduI [Segetibacter sp.]|nr:kduI [Segetibacter sp.]